MSHTIGGLGKFEERDIKRLSVMVDSNEGWPVFLAWLEAWKLVLRDELETNLAIDERDAVAKIRAMRRITDDIDRLPVVLTEKLKSIEAERKTVDKG